MLSTSSKLPLRPLRAVKGATADRPVPAAAGDWAMEAILAVDDPMYVAEPGGAVVLANVAYRAIAAAGEALSPLTAPAAAQVAEAGKAVVADAEIAVDGQPRRFRVTHRPVLDDHGKVTAVVGHYRDVTAVESARTHAERSAGRLDDFTRLLSDWAWEVDRDFCFTYVSPRVLDALGLPARAMLGASLFRLGTFPQAGSTTPTPASRSPFRDLVYRTQGPDRRVRFSRLNGVPVFDPATGAFAGYRGVGTDITQQIEAEARAADAQMRLADAVASISEAFALFGPDDGLVLCNERMRALFPEITELLRPGMRFETLIRHTRNVMQLTPEERDTYVEQRMKRHIEPGEPLEEQRPDGCWLLVSERRTRDGGAVLVATDITELKRREGELATAERVQREARREAEAANHAKSAFLANVSHELRTPLNAIIGFSEIIKNEMYGAVNIPQYAEYVRDIHESGRHLLNLINDILDFSKAEAGKLVLHETEVNLPAVISRCTRLVSELAQRCGVAIEVDTAENPPILFADERKTKQILLNLLSNAIKFTGEGGKVTTRVRVKEDGALALTVIDTGVGMTPEQIPLALSPFVQLEDVMTRRHQGTGLGLPLTKSLVELHGGTLSIASKLGEGTAVTALFPAQRVRPTVA
jgi:signal transduction histidine kinase